MARNLPVIRASGLGKQYTIVTARRRHDTLRDELSSLFRVSFDKMQAMLPGFKARRTAEDGARELVELFERIQLGAETFEFRAFTRIKQLKYLVESGQIDAGFFWRRADD
jgi:hypothetical protein